MERHGHIVLTKNGKRKVSLFLKEMEAKRKELLDAGIDEPGDVVFPTESDIVNDVEEFAEDGEYINSWGVTADYDLPLHLEEGADYAHNTGNIREEILSLDPGGPVNAVEQYLERHFPYSVLTRNILNYAAGQGFADADETKVLLGSLLDGLGLSDGELAAMAEILTQA